MKESTFAWTPSESYLQEANVRAFLRIHHLASERELHRLSIEDPEWFWQAFLEVIGWKWYTPPTRILDDTKGKPWTRWFVGARTNLTDAALDRWLTMGKGDTLALLYESEEGEVRTYTYAELLTEVRRLTAALRQGGIRPGDRVGIHLPLIPETAIALLAVARLGAIAVPLFSGFGSGAVATRLRDAEAKAVITADGLMRRGKAVPMKPVLDEALEQVDSVETVFVVQRTGQGIPWHPNRDHWLHEVMADVDPNAGHAEIVESETPFMLIYTSGTTGKPKATVHVHTGFPVKAAQDMYFLFDVKSGTRIYWVTDIGWMMGPWLILGSLLLGGTMVLYDGAPDYPAPDRLWTLVERHQIQVLGITPTLIRALIPKGDDWVDRHPMPSLRIIGSTGEPWNPEPWLWTLAHVGKNRAPIINYSGGTEISGGILGCYPTLPLKPCSFNTVVPGVDADVWDEDGRPVVGEPGYLVIKNHNPGMTRGFWQSPERYLQTYWARWPGVWEHGDLVRVDEDGYWYILGRADDTLKVAGKRVGPAEVESILVEHTAVRESAVIGVPDPIKGEVPVAFVALKEGVEPSPDLAQALKQRVVEKMGKPLALKDLHFVSDIPKTRNAKLMRRLIKAAYLGRDPGDTSALVNPEVLDEIARLRPET